MASAIGDLVARLRMDTKPFQAGARGAIGGMARIAGAAAKMGAAMVVAGGAFAVFQSKKQFAAIDKTAKLADQLGIATERLQGFRHAAELTGAGSASMDKGLQTLAKRLGEADYKGSAADQAMQKLGLGAEQLANMPVADAFALIADKMGSVESQTVKNAIAANFFSKANMGLVNTLALGSEGLAEAQKEAEALGVAFNRMDAAKTLVGRCLKALDE